MKKLFPFFLLLALSACAAALPANPPTPTATPTSLSASPEPSPTPTPPPAGCPDTDGTVSEDTLESAYLPKGLTYRLYLPPCYDAQRAQGYPVIYLLHGQNYTSDQWQRLGAVETADEMIAAGSAQPFILALPYEEYSLSNASESGFGDAIVEELVPFIDSHYNTCADRACRAIGGLSRGAAWAVHLGLTRWDLFGVVGAHSLPPFNSETGIYLVFELRDIPAGQFPLLRMDSGKDDPWLPDARRFDQGLADGDMQHEFVISNGAHDETYWAGQMPDYIAWYAQALQTGR